MPLNTQKKGTSWAEDGIDGDDDEVLGGSGWDADGTAKRLMREAIEREIILKQLVAQGALPRVCPKKSSNQESAQSQSHNLKQHNWDDPIVGVHFLPANSQTDRS
jgi:hypothetical protein